MESNDISDLGLALRCARVGIWELEPHQGRIRCRAAPEFLGIPCPPSVDVKQALRWVHPEDRRELTARLRSALQLREPRIHHLRLRSSAEATPLWVENHIEAVTDEASGSLRLTGVMIDITSHKQALVALTAADRRKDDFIAMLGHELRSPLTAIGTAAQILKATVPEHTPSSHCVDMIRRQATHLGRLVEDLLDISRAVRDRLEIKRAHIDLRQALEDALQAVDALIKQHRHRVETTIPAEAVLVEADAVRITQALENILTNAAKYTPAAGTLQVALETSGEWAVVRVRDSGIGLAAEDLALIFEPFYQVDASITRAHGGLGIGLALVRRIVQLHSGTVHAFSAGPGCGCELVVRLPTAPGVLGIVPPVDTRSAAAGLDSGRSRRILVADDDADAAEALALGLRMCGHEVVVAFDGEEALRLADEFRPHVALLDLTMPIRPGHEVARELRSRDWALEQRLLMVALTGWSPSSIEGRIDMSVFDSQVTKPTELAAVSQLVSGPPPPRKQVT
jgi:signal transduction histidine kinase/CheY-like chemotaxis protein